MIPYINWTTIELGPLTLRVWGLFVAMGFLFGAYMAGRMAKSHGDDPKIIYDLTFWLMLNQKWITLSTSSRSRSGNGVVSSERRA